MKAAGDGCLSGVTGVKIEMIHVSNEEIVKGKIVDFRTSFRMVPARFLSLERLLMYNHARSCRHQSTE